MKGPVKARIARACIVAQMEPPAAAANAARALHARSGVEPTSHAPSAPSPAWTTHRGSNSGWARPSGSQSDGSAAPITQLKYAPAPTIASQRVAPSDGGGAQSRPAPSMKPPLPPLMGERRAVAASDAFASSTYDDNAAPSASQPSRKPPPVSAWSTKQLSRHRRRERPEQPCYAERADGLDAVLAPHSLRPDARPCPFGKLECPGRLVPLVELLVDLNGRRALRQPLVSAAEHPVSVLFDGVRSCERVRGCGRLMAP
eukprot:scaffold135566_cov28-Tisochrysis_lutea.AAC.2